MRDNNICKDILFGVSVGDALGVPYEFKSREIVAKNPATDITGYGTYKIPAGTFSDDSSLTFCLAEALTEGYSLQAIANNFVAWLNDNYWTATNVVFDVGIATTHAIRNLETECSPELAGGRDVSDNGNGSLMRILPLLVYIKDKDIADSYFITKQVSSITHGHIRSVIACFYYLEFAKLIIKGETKFSAYILLQKSIPEFLNQIEVPTDEINIFHRLLNENIYELSEERIYSSGYVLHT